CFDFRNEVRRVRTFFVRSQRSRWTRVRISVSLAKTGTHRQSAMPMRRKGRMTLMGKSMEYQGYTIQSTPYYETERKQCLIDAKLIGRSVADMKTTDRRVTPR